MTTKEQERKALEQIKSIINSMGEDSYIGTAFAGCVEDAEANIENDFALSMKNRYETSEERNKALTLTLAQAERKIKELEAKVSDLIDKLDSSHVLGDDLAHKLNDERRLRHEAENAATENWNKLQDAESELDEKEDEIIRLKAKLYDLLVR